MVDLMWMMRAMSTARTLPWWHKIWFLNGIMLLYDPMVYLIRANVPLVTYGRVFARVSLTRLVGCISPEKVCGLGIGFWIGLDVGIRRRHHGHILLIFKLALRGLAVPHLIRWPWHVHSGPRVRDDLGLVCMNRLLLVWILKNRKVIDLSIFLRNLLRVHWFLNCKKTIIILYFLNINAHSIKHLNNIHGRIDWSN